jgi:hypothetical protein
MMRIPAIQSAPHRHALTQKPGQLLGLAMIALLFAAEPALANKFETIGGGVSGSAQFKQEWLKGFLYIVGGLSLLTTALAVFVPHNNALYLNFANWKQSAIVSFLIAVACFVGALLL